MADQQNSPGRGWRAFESTRNRYWITENLNNPIYRPLRKFIFDYHAAENDGEQLQWQKSDYDRQARSYGGSLEQIEYSLPDDSTWEYYEHGDTLYSITSMAQGR